MKGRCLIKCPARTTCRNFIYNSILRATGKKGSAGQLPELGYGWSENCMLQNRATGKTELPLSILRARESGPHLANEEEYILSGLVFSIFPALSVMKTASLPLSWVVWTLNRPLFYYYIGLHVYKTHYPNTRNLLLAID